MGRVGCPAPEEEPAQVTQGGVHSLGGGRGLHAPGGRQRPVLARVGAEGTLPRVPVDLQLEGLLVSLFVLIGRQVHSCKGRPEPVRPLRDPLSLTLKDTTGQWASRSVAQIP